ncbi:MAG TPA: PTS sugar transporter subunit IIB [Peptococcaceae bacterium]|nr:PTS sugar transporter subunit IIB [Peptococcaceae bacterium]HPZ71529.1 PTS sugar transporter subunit IIB [Peptococcaceae bacterium]HQD53439.1 PTS sugar transporter subunit IIB [Peptococcaceae bacterium]
MAKVRIMCVCGTGIATSTVAHDGIEKICKKHGIDFDIIQCKALEVASQVGAFKPDIIISTTPISAKTSVPIVSGIPLLTGVGIEKLEQDVLEVLKDKK